jgi:hypothetical protein
VCIGAKNDACGKFFIPFKCRILSFKLVYVSGDGVSYRYPGSPKQYWGSNNIQMHITNDKNERISPSSDVQLDMQYNKMSYSLPGVTTMSKELPFPQLSPPLDATAGQEFRVWFGQDLKNESEYNNDGQTCADVIIQYYQP